MKYRDYQLMKSKDNQNFTLSKNEGDKTLPQLRFPEFEDDGEWEESSLGEIAKFRRGSFPQPYGLPEWYDDKNGKPFIQVYDVDSNLKIKPKTKRRISQLAAKKSVFIEKGTVIITIQGSIGRVAITQHDAYIDRTLLLFEDFFISIDKLFFAYVLQLLFEVEKHKAPGGIIKTITKEVLTDFNIHIPSIEEQQKIADCLSSFDDLIGVETEQIEALKDHKKGLMQQLFSAEGETLPQLRFTAFEDGGEWNISTIEGVSSISSGGTPSRSEPNYWNGDIPWVSTTLIDFNKISSAKEFITESGLKNSSTKVFSEGTILMAMYGQGKTRGKVAVLNIKAAINQACTAISLKKGMNIEFVFQNLAARYDEIRKISNQGGQENLSVALIKKIPFSYPEIDSKEQQKIADCLSSIDHLIAVHADRIEILKDHKKGLMQQLFPSINELAV